MSDAIENAVEKVHPASREVLPGDPLELQAVELPGDADVMLRMLVEEYARIGWDAEAILALARDPNYTAFHALRQTLGEAKLLERVVAILARCGVMRVDVTETIPLSERLVQIDEVRR